MYYKLHYEKEIRKPKGKATFRFGSTLCKFHPGFEGKFMHLISLNILYIVENKSNVYGPKTCT